jgi:lipopolysaccharide transport system ATP-binding protein
MAAVKKLCTRGVVLENGRVVFESGINESVSKYLKLENSNITSNNNGVYNFEDHPDKKRIGFGIMKANLFCDNHLSDEIYSGSELKLEIYYNSYRDFHEAEIGFVIKDQNNVAYLGLNNKHLGINLKINEGKGKAIIKISNFPIFANDIFRINLYFGDQGPNYESLLNALEFKVITTDVFGSGRKLDPIWNKIYSNNITINNL